MNKLFLSIAFILIGSFINAQEVEIKDINPLAALINPPQK